MAGLDNIPQKTTVEIEVVKLDEDILKTIIDEIGRIFNKWKR